AGLGGHLDEFIEKTRGADKVVVVEGCDKDCGRHVMNRCGFEDYEYIRITDLGIEKAKPKRAEENEIAMVVRQIEARL
ncbi:MAG: putative zinc-binding protein, partial [bacterium]